MRTLVLVLGARTAPYPALMRSSERTWASQHVPELDVLFYSGGRSLELNGRRLHLPVPDDLAHAGEKTFACFDFVLASRPFDVVFRTNCSSYVDLPNLRAFVEEQARATGFYAGVTSEHEGVPFASGSGYFLSRDLVELAVSNRAEWDHSLLDDVALGKLLEARGVVPISAPRQDVAWPVAVDEVDTTQFHVRCKSDWLGRRKDAEALLAVHNAFRRARGLAPVQEPVSLRLARGVRRAASAARSTASSFSSRKSA